MLKCNRCGLEIDPLTSYYATDSQLLCATCFATDEAALWCDDLDEPSFVADLLDEADIALMEEIEFVSAPVRKRPVLHPGPEAICQV